MLAFVSFRLAQNQLQNWLFPSGKALCFWSHHRCFELLGKFQHDIKISVKMARVSRLSVSCDYDETEDWLRTKWCFINVVKIAQTVFQQQQIETSKRNRKDTGLRKSVSLSLIGIYLCLFVNLRVVIPLQSINATLRSIWNPVTL